MVMHEGKLREAFKGIRAAIAHLMPQVSWRRVSGTLGATVWLFLLAAGSPAFGQASSRLCPPVSERTGEPGPTCSTGNQKLGATAAGPLLLAPGHLPHARRSGGSQRTARNRRGIAWKDLAVHHRRGRVAPVWRRARRGNRPATRQVGHRVHGGVHGKHFRSGDDGTNPYTFGSGSLLHPDRRNMSGDPRRRARWARGRARHHCARRSSDASKGHRCRAASRYGAHPS